MVLLKKITFINITAKVIFISAFAVGFITKNATSADEQNSNLPVAQNVIKNNTEQEKSNNLPVGNIQKKDDKSADFLPKTAKIDELRQETKVENQTQKNSNTIVKKQEENKQKPLEQNVKINAKDEKKNNKTDEEEKDKMFENFNLARSINFVLDKVRFENFHFIETDNDLILLRQALLAQEIEEHQKKVKNAKGKQISFNSIKLNSLLYFGPNNWKMKINGELIKPETKNNAHSSVVVVSVNKSSVAFMLKNSTATLIQKVKDIKEKKYPYYQNYHIITRGGQQYIMFKLFIGQMIDLDSLLFSG